MKSEEWSRYCPIRESYREHVHPLFRDAKFLISGLNGSSAAVLGAAAVGWGYIK